MTQRYWVFLAGALALTALISYMTYTSARLLRHWRPDRNLLLLPAENLLRLALIALCLGLGWLSGLSPAQLGWRWPAQTGVWLIALLWGAAVATVFITITPWVTKQGGENYYSPIVVDAIAPRNRRELWLVSLAMIPVVVLEELLFRSLLIGGLAPVAPVTLLVIGWSILFGLLHSPQGRLGMAGAGMGGALLGWLFVRYSTLVAPLLAHYVINIVQLFYAMRANKASS